MFNFLINSKIMGLKEKLFSMFYSIFCIGFIVKNKQVAEKNGSDIEKQHPGKRV